MASLPRRTGVYPPWRAVARLGKGLLFPAPPDQRRQAQHQQHRGGGLGDLGHQDIIDMESCPAICKEAQLVEAGRRSAGICDVIVRLAGILDGVLVLVDPQIVRGRG